MLATPPGGSNTPKVELRFFNVSLEEDEYLSLVVLPKSTTGAATMIQWLETESRQLTLD